MWNEAPRNGTAIVASPVSIHRCVPHRSRRVSRVVPTGVFVSAWTTRERRASESSGHRVHGPALGVRCCPEALESSAVSRSTRPVPRCSVTRGSLGPSPDYAATTPRSREGSHSSGSFPRRKSTTREARCRDSRWLRGCCAERCPWVKYGIAGRVRVVALAWRFVDRVPVVLAVPRRRRRMGRRGCAGRRDRYCARRRGRAGGDDSRNRQLVGLSW